MTQKRILAIFLIMILVTLSISPMITNAATFDGSPWPHFQIINEITSSDFNIIDASHVADYFGEGTYTATYTIQSVTQRQTNLSLFVLLYSSNKLEAIKTDKKDIDQNATVNLNCTLTLPSVKPGDTIKVVILETDSLNPIINAIGTVIPNKDIQSPSPSPVVLPPTSEILDPFPAGVVLTADQYVICDDGNDTALFIPKVYNKYNQLLPIVNSDMYYYLEDYLYDDDKFTSTDTGMYSVYAQYGAYRSGKIAINVVPQYNISLSCDKQFAIADGIDKVTLSAMMKDKSGNPVEKNDITFSLYCSNTGNIYTQNPVLTFTEPGTYYVTADWHGNYQSNKIRIIVSQFMKPVISANKTEILADGVEAITFSGAVYDINNQPISYPPTLTYYVNGSIIQGNSFKTTTSGDYSVYAVVNYFKSNTIAFKANEVVLAANPGENLATYRTFETTLDGSKSTGKPNKPITAYEWRTISKPEGSTAALSNNDIAKPVFAPDIEGDYVFGLKVSDGTDTSDEKTVTVKAKILGDTTDFVSANTSFKAMFPSGYNYSDFIALSDGWVIAKDTSLNKIVFVNGITGKKGREYSLTSIPNKLEIDYERGLIFASLTSVGKIAKIDVYTGEITYISINGAARDIEMGENGVLFVGGTDIQVVDIEQEKVVSTVANAYGADAIGMEYDKVGNNLILPYSDSYDYSYRYTFDENNFSLSLAQKYYNESNKYRMIPKISEDGKHLIYQYYGSNIYEYDCNDISISIGQYSATSSPSDFAFSLDSSTVAMNIGSAIMLYDTTNRFNTRTISKSNSYNSDDLSFSRGGKFIYNYESDYGSNAVFNIYASGITQSPVEPIKPINKPVALISGINSFVGFTSVLDASNSRLSGGDALTYTWSLVSKPNGSTVSLSSTDQKTLSFTTDVEGEYKVSLVVNNGKSSSETAYKTIKSKKIDSAVDDIDLTKISSNITLKYSFKGAIPLCDGWIITADSTNCVVIANALTGSILKSYQLTSAPSSLALDFDTGTLLATMLSSSKLAKINIYSGAITYIDMPSTCSIVVTADKNKAFVRNSNGVCIVNYVQNTVSATASVGGSMMAFDKVNNFLFSANTGISAATLYKYSYNSTSNTITLVTSSNNLGSNGLDLRVSPDGKHLAFCAGSGNSGYVIFDIDPQDITKSNGIWNTSAYPTAAYFTLDNKYFIGSNGSDIKLFDVENHYLIATVGSFSHDYEKIYFSRGSKLIYYFNGSTGYCYKNTWIQ